jgi:hypothetical protein
LPRKARLSNVAEIGEAASDKAVGSDFRAAAIRAVEEDIQVEEEAIQAAVGIPAVVATRVVEAIRMTAAKGDIPTMILAGAEFVR